MEDHCKAIDMVANGAAHVVVFAVLTVLLGLTLQSGGYPLWYLSGVVLWSYVDEATKPLVQERHFSWFDVGLNLLGTGIGVGLIGVAGLIL